tara:strand:- start:52 stop:1266 length:1215 start_codon:yes stop_codon:yes gene_type:complete
MDYQLIFERWRKYNFSPKNENVDTEQPTNNEKKKNSSEINKVLQSDREMGDAIKKMSPGDVRKSSLFYDGVFLYWMLDNKPIQKWRASSGSHEVLIDAQWKAKAVFNAIKKMREKKPRQEIIRDLMNFVEWSPKTNLDPRGIGRVRIKRIHAEELYDAFKSNNRKKVMNELEFIFWRYGIDDTYMSAEQKRKASSKAFAGPIPEGEYGIFHKLQDLPSHRAAEPSIYDTLYLAMSQFVGDSQKSDFPFERIDDEEFKKEIEKNMTVIDPENEDDASKWLKVQDAIKWGTFRVRITKLNKRANRMMKVKGAGYDKRDGFLIHGGSIRGSAGCIDLGEEIDSFGKFWTIAGVGKAVAGGGRPGTLQSAGFKIPLIVKYSDDAKDSLLNNDMIAKRFQKAIFRGIGR